MTSRSSLPTGTVTFLFTDIEGSTRLLRELGPERYGPLQDHHTRLLREAIRKGDGTEIRTEGDAVFAVFPSANGAVRAAVAAQRALAAHPWPDDGVLRVRMGMHTGEGRLGGDDYLGIDVNLAARIAAAGHGGQVLLSGATRDLAGDLPEGVEVRDLGRHRLKDFADSAPIHDLVIQGLPAEFPPLKTLEVPTRLPAPLTAFVGRGPELAKVKELLQAARLLTLTGPGGTGKTRLAVQAATELAPGFPDGAFFVDLAAVVDPTVVPDAIAGVLGVREEGGRPLLETLQEMLRDRRLLLVLDNLEQVLDAGPGIGGLLTSAPGLRVVATSRAPLRITGEQELPVPPMALPDPAEELTAEALVQNEAVALFAQRAAAVDPGFEVTEENARAVAAICARLDGLPLAIELAASRVALLPPEALLERLERRLPVLVGGARDRPARQRTLRGAIEWSHDLLDEPERVLFRRLAVFSGGWTLEAAEAVTGMAEEGADVLEGLASLTERSLVRRASGHDRPRFAFLETIREYGLERLEEDERAGALRRRHADHYLELAEEDAGRIGTPGAEAVLARLEDEHDNVRAALAWAVREDLGEVALRLVGAMWRFWQVRGHLSEGRRWADQALGLPSASARTAARAAALTALGGLAYWQGDLPTVGPAYREALAISEEIGDAHGVALATYNVAFVPALEGDRPASIELMRRSRELFEALGDARGTANALASESVMHRLEGDPEEALRLAEEALARRRERGDWWGVSEGLYMAGRARFELGDLDASEGLFLEALDLLERHGDRPGMTIVFDNLANIAAARGDHTRALRLAGVSSRIKDSGAGQAPAAFLDLPDPRELARSSLGGHEIAAAWERGRAMSLGEGLAFARAGAPDR